MTTLDLDLIPAAPVPVARRTIAEHLRHLAAEYGAVLDHEHLPALADTLRQYLLVTADRAETAGIEAEILRGEAADRERAVSQTQRLLAALGRIERSVLGRGPSRTPTFEDGAEWVLGQLRQALNPEVTR